MRNGYVIYENGVKKAPQHKDQGNISDRSEGGKNSNELLGSRNWKTVIGKLSRNKKKKKKKKLTYLHLQKWE